MKKNKCENEERSLLKSFEKDEWRSIASLEDEIAAYRAFAATQVERDRQINVNLSKEDWDTTQKRARQTGVPSETVITNIVHQFAKGNLG